MKTFYFLNEDMNNCLHENNNGRAESNVLEVQKV